MTLAAAAQHLPDPVIHALRSAKNTAASAQRAALRPIQRRQLRTAVRELQALAPELPSRELVSRLIRAWNNRAADEPGYLLSVIEHAREADGPILECGSGLTTIALAVYSKQTVVSLENDPKWFKTLATDLHYLGLASNGLVLSPLKAYEDFLWYTVTPEIPERIALVVCDGPPLRGKPGGRIGLMPLLGDRLQPGAVVLVDSDMQVAEVAAIDTWQSEYGLRPVPTAGVELVMIAG